MKEFLSRAAVLPIIVIVFSFGTSLIQPYHTATPRTLSAKDKSAINDIFKTIGVRNFRMEFGLNEAYGSYLLPDPVVKALRSGSHIDSDILVTDDLYKSYQPQLSFWYYLDRSRSEGLEGIFGKANAARLNAIINKYTGGQ